jgi:anti-anti-sigma factor
MTPQAFEAHLRHPVMHLRRGMIIDMSGEINGSVEVPLKAAFSKAEAEDPEVIILNFTDVNYINSTGIALIVGLLARAQAAKRTLAVYGLSEHYNELFNITRLADYIQLYPDEQRAVAEIASSEIKRVE